MLGGRMAPSRDMFFGRPTRLLLAVAVLVLGASAGSAAATEPDASVQDAKRPSAAGPLKQEYAGIEASPLGIVFGDAPVTPSRYQPGGGAIFRFGRYRWRYAYLTPAELGFFFSSETILLHAQIETGLVLPGPLSRLEVGLGAGLGLVRIAYANTGCDGTCSIGGVGPLFSPLVRYLFVDDPKLSVGASVRALIPVMTPTGDWFGYFTGAGQIVLAAVDVAFGSGR
jgi:hypothetical protein